MGRKALVLFLIILSIGVYINTIGHQFVYDDIYFSNRLDLSSWLAIPRAFVESYIINNPTAGFYRPMAIASFAITYTLFGKSPLPFHVTNILLHMIATLLVFVLAREFKISFLSSWGAAVLFAVLPVHTEAVAFIKSRDEIFYAIFFILALWSFLRVGEGRKTFFVYSLISILSFLFALFSKEMAIVIPIVCLLTALYKRLIPKQIIFFIGGWGAVFCVYVLLRYIALGKDMFGSYNTLFPGYEFYISSGITRLFTAFYIYFLNLRSMVFPVYLSATYGYAQILPISGPFSSWLWIPGFITALCTVSFAIYLFLTKQKKAILFLLGFLILYLPMSQIITVGGDLIAERWMYTPSVFFAIFISFIFSHFLKRWYYIAVVACIATLFAIRIIIRNPVWATNSTIFSDMVQTAPKSVHAQTVLAREYLTQGNTEKAEMHAKIAESIYSKYAPLHTLMGDIAAKNRKWDDAIDHYNKAIALFPSSPNDSTGLGKAYYEKGNYVNALQYFETVYDRSHALKVQDILWYAKTLTKLGKYQESLRALVGVVNKDPPDPYGIFLTAVNLYRMGQTDVVTSIIWDKSLSETERKRQIESF